VRVPGIIKCTVGSLLTIVALDVYSYRMHELLVSLALFSAVFLLVVLSTLSTVLLCWAGKQLASRALGASRRVIAYSRGIISAHAKP
jgi:hypothetical protein